MTMFLPVNSAPQIAKPIVRFPGVTKQKQGQPPNNNTNKHLKRAEKTNT